MKVYSPICSYCAQTSSNLKIWQVRRQVLGHFLQVQLVKLVVLQITLYFLLNSGECTQCPLRIIMQSSLFYKKLWEHQAKQHQCSLNQFQEQSVFPKGTLVQSSFRECFNKQTAFFMHFFLGGGGVYHKAFVLQSGILSSNLASNCPPILKNNWRTF